MECMKLSTRKSAEHTPFTKADSKQVGRQAGIDIFAAAICLFGAVTIYSICLLRGDPLYGYEEPSYVLARRLLWLAWLLLVAVLVGLLLRKGLPAKAWGWKKTAIGALASPYAATAICCATDNLALLHTIPINLIEVAFWPALSAMLAHTLLVRERPLSRGTALFSALNLGFIILSTCIEKYQHDYFQFFAMAVTSVGVWLIAAGGAKGVGGRGKAALVLVVAGCLAAALAICLDWRFWDILSEQGSSIWVADRMESLQRFFAFDFEGWDCLPERNALYLVANVAGPIAAAAYIALPIASVGFMVRVCSKLARTMKESLPAADALAISAHGVAYGTIVALGLAATLLNINTCVGVAQGLGAVPAMIMLFTTLIGRFKYENGEPDA